jgi:ankyrin repeat protein
MLVNTAAINGYADIVDSLLAHGANTEVKDEVMKQTNTLF